MPRCILANLEPNSSLTLKSYLNDGGVAAIDKCILVQNPVTVLGFLCQTKASAFYLTVAYLSPSQLGLQALRCRKSCFG